MGTDRRRVSSGSPFEPVIGFSRGIRVGDRVWISGTAPVWPDGSVDPDPGTQMRRCLEIAVGALEELGGSADDVVRTRIFLTDPSDWEAVGRAHGERFAAAGPAATMVAVGALLDPRWKVEVELEAVVADRP
jgi:enamine deaminase RidA (YjgF/YER057c/UK114 family)